MSTKQPASQQEPKAQDVEAKIPKIQTFRFRITTSAERCCLCHSLAQNIVGIDEASQKQIEGWEYYCATCKQLVMSARQVDAALLRPATNNKIGRVVAVSFPLVIERGS